MDIHFGKVFLGNRTIKLCEAHVKCFEKYFNANTKYETQNTYSKDAFK